MGASELTLRKFVAPEFTFGIGARTLAGRFAKNLGAAKVLVVTDPGVIAAGWTADVTRSLESAGLLYAIFAGVSANPRAEEVMTGAARYREEACDAVVAVGGGSPMDCAKGIGIVSSNGGHILDYEGIDEVAQPMPPLLCVPTTGGTSADISQFAIITDTGRRAKIAIISKAVVPDVSLIDPETLTTMEPYLTACTGIDALVHAIEAFVSRASSQITDIHATEGIRLIRSNLADVMRTPNDVKLRGEIMLGSLEAGLAFSNASLGATHAMAHSLGGLLDLPHGECNAILLPHVLAYNLPEATERYDRIGAALGLDLRGMGRHERQEAILADVAGLRKALGIERGLGDVGVRRTDVSDLARCAMLDPCLVTNPRRPTQRDIEVIYEEAL